MPQLAHAHIPMPGGGAALDAAKPNVVSESDDLLVSPIGDGLQITLNEPTRGNAASDAMAVRLTELLLRAADRAAYVVLRGSGDDFCTGRFNPKPPSGGAKPEALAVRRKSDVIFDCYQAFRACSVPIIGVVQGRALGFGCSIAALCDITIAADTARFQIPEMNHQILPTMVMSSLIDRVARKDVAYLVLTREMIDAERAREMHIVSDVVPAGELEATIVDLVALFDVTPEIALQGAKAYLNAAYDMPIAGAVDYARNLHATINTSSEMKT
jgi:enoyl-CoA hydratase